MSTQDDLCSHQRAVTKIHYYFIINSTVVPCHMTTQLNMVNNMAIVIALCLADNNLCFLHSLETYNQLSQVHV